MIRRLILIPVWRLACLIYYRTALRQIDPLHPDVPLIVLRLADLEPARRPA